MTDAQAKRLEDLQTKLDNIDTAIIDNSGWIADIQTTLNADPEKYSTTVLNVRGNNGTRAGWQRDLDSRVLTLQSLKEQRPVIQKSLDDYKAEIARQSQASFFEKNPSLLVEVQKTKAEAEQAAQSKLFAQKNTQYLIIGGILIVVVAIGFMLWKKYSK